MVDILAVLPAGGRLESISTKSSDKKLVYIPFN